MNTTPIINAIQHLFILMLMSVLLVQMNVNIEVVAFCVIVTSFTISILSLINTALTLFVERTVRGWYND